jgi:glutamyl-tRNA reductase
MGVLAAGKLAQSGARKVLVINRTYRKATELAMAHEWTASVYEDLALLLSDVDVVICSTGARQAVLTHDMVKAAAKKRRYRPLFLIDIAVPRDIDSKCSQVNDVYLYNIDDLEEVSRTNAELRQSELTAAEVIIEDQLHSIQNRQSEQIAGPIIARLREYSQRLANAEAQKTCRMIPQLDDKGAKAVQKLATVIANRMIGNSITLLKNAADSAELEELATMVEQLFELGDSDDLGNGDDGEVDGGVDGDTAKADAGEKSRHELHELHDMNDENPPPPVDLGSGNESR